MLKAGESLDKNDAMLVAVNSVARKLLAHNAAQSFDEIVMDCLRVIGETLNQNRVYIWRDTVNTDEQICCIQVYEWTRGVQSIQGEAAFENVPYDSLPSLRDALDKGQCLNQLVVNLTESEQHIFEPQGILSLIVAPIMIDGLRWGFIGVDNCESLALFTPYEENMLLTSGFMLASAILKQATETNLRQSEELVQAMFNATPLCCNVWNSKFELLICNDSAVRLFDLEDKESFTRYFNDLSPQFQPCGRPSYELAHAYVAEAFRTGHLEFEWLHQKLNGEPVPVHVTLERINYRNQIAVAGYVRDLRELKAQEEKRRTAEERTNLMLNAMPLCCNFWDKDFNNIACNDEAVRLFELNSQQDYLERFFELSPERQPCGALSSEMAMGKLIQTFSEGYAHFEWLHQRLDGTPIPAEVTLIRLVFKNELFVVGYTRDLREHKAMLAEIQAVQQDLALARDEALAHSKAKSDFLANMSHEIRTPMNGIIGLSYLALQFPEIDPQLRGYIIKIDDSAKALLRIINDILDFSKINAGKLDIEHLPFDLAEMLEHAIQPLIPTLAEKGLELLLDFAEDTPTRLVGDAVRLRQVILNLVSNAVKFTHEGSIVIRIECPAQGSMDTTLRFSVADTGVGIAPEYLARLFEAFSQADTSVTRRYGGTGLGLAICKQIITLMGGEINVQSSVGVGSTFTFTARFGIAEGGAFAGGLPRDLDGRRILVADDNEISRKILTKYLQSFGASVDCAEDGQEALAMFMACLQRGEPYYGVVVDWKMPGMSGLDVAAGIREIAEENIPPIVMVTAYEREIVAPDALHAGIDTVLTKPVTPASLHDALLKAATDREKAQPDTDCLAAAVNEGGAPEVAVGGRPGRCASPLSGKRILLAEDNEINQLIAVELLSSHGIAVSIVGTGREAVTQALAGNFDAILMDIQMPEMDGIEATRFIRGRYPTLDSTPIIAMTAHAMTGDHEKSITAGMQAHITKPIDPEELYATLLRWIPGDKSK